MVHASSKCLPTEVFIEKNPTFIIKQFLPPLNTAAQICFSGVSESLGLKVLAFTNRVPSGTMSYGNDNYSETRALLPLSSKKKDSMQARI